jgi:ABC-type bacteriocin/lantibiotic exporter with double-glycine peptidase domain
MNWITNNEWLKPDADNRVRWDQLGRFLRNYRPFRARLLGAGALVLLGSSTVFLIPLIFRAMQRAVVERSVSLLAWALLGFLAANLFEAATSYGVRMARVRVSTSLNRELVLQYYRKILNLAVEDFIAFRQRTNLFQRLIDAMLITDQFSDTLIRGAQGVVVVAVTAAVIGLLSPAVLAVLAVGTLLLFAYTLSQSEKLKALHQRTLSLNYPLVGKMTEIIDGLFIIKALSASVRVTSDVLHLVDGKRDAEYREFSADVASQQITQALRSAVQVAAVGAACLLMMQGSLTFADVVALYVLSNLLLGPVAELAARYHGLSKLSVNVASFYEVLNLQDEADEVRAAVAARDGLDAGEGGAALPAGAGDEGAPAVQVFAVAHPAGNGNGNGNGKGVEHARAAEPLAVATAVLPAPRFEAEERGVGHIHFQGLDFAYRGGEMVLRGVELEIHPGEHVALIGKSGVGKTTMIRLLLGFLQPQRGALAVDGVDITRLADKNAYRRRFGVVSQRDVFFGVSLRENLTFGLHEAVDDERIEDAVRMVNLGDAVDRFDRGLDTQYSDDLFSGGEKQRLFIARALLRRPDIVVMDEPTSALDFESERKVMEALERLAGEKTTITIAHRLSTVQSCDRVVLIEGGTVAASGTHRELYETSDYYRSLCEYNSFMM